MSDNNYQEIKDTDENDEGNELNIIYSDDYAFNNYNIKFEI
jgi:hypothetical protein